MSKYFEFGVRLFNFFDTTNLCEHELCGPGQVSSTPAPIPLAPQKLKIYSKKTERKWNNLSCLNIKTAARISTRISKNKNLKKGHSNDTSRLEIYRRYPKISAK